MKLAVLTSGGDSSGMNPAVRAIVRAGLSRGDEVYAVYEGYLGLVEEGSARIKRVSWEDMSGVLQRGGTVLGTARCKRFREREGRRRAAFNLASRGIDKLVVIGGDGSLTGADIFRREWPSLLAELVADGSLRAEVAQAHPSLSVVGLVGSIDNDMAGTDMTIGADTALHRITEALDAIGSTAASHRRAFVVEVMGRHCGYLALMSAVAGECDWVLLPEHPPAVDDWEARMVASVKAGQDAGRRDSIVVVAEGARDRHGDPISSAYVERVLAEGLGVDVRTTVLGHVQRGGSPTAYDRNLATAQGLHAVEALAEGRADAEPIVMGWRGNRVQTTPLSQCLAENRAIADAIKAGEYQTAMALRGPGFVRTWGVFRSLVRATPRPPEPGQRRLRLAVLTAGAPSPGMNAAVYAATRLAIARGHQVFGVRGGFQGLASGGDQVFELGWDAVAGWSALGGSELGTRVRALEAGDLYGIARTIEQERIDGLLCVGDWSAYLAASRLHGAREQYPAFDVPIVCLPATINNDLPGSELAVGADTALNAIVDAVDKIKRCAGAQSRVYVVEVMGGRCGYLALMSGMATGAERVYLHEEGVKLRDLQADLEDLVAGFERGKRLGLVIRAEGANDVYDARFMEQLLEEEGGDLFDVRVSILGHLQQGGDPSPFDRVQATRLAAFAIDHLIGEAERDAPEGVFLGGVGGRIEAIDFGELERMADMKHRRPRRQWWEELRPVQRLLAQAESAGRDNGAERPG
ncbi:MAG: 6-phosphofructokinase [Proteobacteria bacterium]|nr:MAG: 6-phosphofructokinase [Pseudomonadota bacterium]